ncbi:MAG: DMT family transporter [Gammaproteobacteria bacterium]|nr:DMT family transporter [Gammaproteobacteria bacterium]MDP2346244.1 DMT family transporter [Gammaproteobacteria bacterium]
MTSPNTTWNNPWLQIHFCVFLWGFTAILGRLITLPALPLVLWRMLMVAGVLLVLPGVWRGLASLSRRHLLAFSGVGVLVALHWLTFYGSIKLANASVAATCMALVPVFLCVIEPIVTGSRFRPRELLLGVLVLPGIALVVGGTPDMMNPGIFVGVLSAFLVALFSAFNKRLVTRTDPLSVTAIEMLAGGLFLALLSGGLLLIPLEGGAGAILPVSAELFAVPPGEDLGYLLILAFGCTLLPFALSLHALRRLSAYASALAVNMEPIYAIMLAILILDEQRELNAGFYAGALIIVAVVFIYPLQSRR